jgi:CRISPR-associated protein Cas1
LPHLDQILIFGHAQVTTQLIQSCLERNIPIAYLSHMGYCAGPSSTGRCRPTSSL